MATTKRKRAGKTVSKRASKSNSVRRNAVLAFKGGGGDLWRKGSKVARRWSRVRSGMTVDAAVKAGATMGDVRYAALVTKKIDLKGANTQ